MPSVNYYDIRGVGRKARPAEIKKAYKRLARKCHPDLNPGSRAAEEQFKRITAAYEVLSDPTKRRRYDQTDSHAAAPPSESGFPGFDPGGGPGFAFSEADLGRGFSDIFEEIFSREPDPRKREPRPGQDRVHPMQIGFFEALKGLTTTLELEGEEACPACGGTGSVPVPRAQICPDCHGAGKIQKLGGRIRFTSACHRCSGSGRLTEESCRRCRGTGTIPQHSRLQVQIPPGVETGSRVRLSGKGGAGILGGPPGDLYIQIQVDSHPFFSRTGDQILCSVPISFSEAALGARIEVPTIDGSATIRIPPRTQSGQKLRLREKGAPSLRGGARGDQIVEVRVVTPEIRDERVRALLRELAERDRTDLRGFLESRS